jgi:sensor histidine kinase regulating citrate/malate metabolism
MTYHITLREGWAILFIFFITLFIGLSILEMNIASGNYKNRYLIMSVIGLIIINILSFYILTYISKENDKRIRYYLLEVQVESQINEINELQNQYSEILKLRHDYKNYILCGLTLLKEEKMVESEKYFNKILDEKLSPEVSYIHTKNSAVNAIINAKLSKCRELGITVHYEIVDEIYDDEIDLSILFANLFDNAIDACSNKPEKSMIYLTVGYEKAYLNIVMKNTIEKPVLLYNPYLLTTKKDKTKHGYGLKTVDDIVKKYDGIKKYYEKENWFYADIWLKSPLET